MTGSVLGAPRGPDERIRRPRHLWQPYPLDDADSLFQCSGCHVLADAFVTTQLIPGACPAKPPCLPHILRNRDGVLSCVGCPVPPIAEWEWECGGGPHARRCEACHANRLTTIYRWFQLAYLCAACAATKRT